MRIVVNGRFVDVSDRAFARIQEEQRAKRRAKLESRPVKVPAYAALALKPAGSWRAGNDIGLDTRTDCG